MSTMETHREKRRKHPSRRLIENNAATPELSSHRDSIASAQIQSALAVADTQAAQRSLTPARTPSESAVGRNQGQADQVSANRCLDSSGSIGPGPSQDSQPTTAIISRPGSIASSDSEESICAVTKKKKKKRVTRKRKRSTSDPTEVDENGMYKDVHVMEITSGDESDDKPKNKRNPTADIDKFFEPTKHIKGEKRGRRQCRACA
jgi:hypothetical protein